MGPTATGKTALALELAERIGAEIVSVDSALVYRGMDIGTAKPSRAERARVPHHLIDIREPEETWSAADFAEHARRLIGEIHRRGRVPLLVGGTMLYFRALIDGLDRMPEVDPEVRLALRARLPQVGAAALHAELRAVDPVSARRIHPNDPQRILRALEIYRSTGQPLSAFQSGRVSALPDDWHCLALLPEDRARLRERIALRFDAMMAAGLERELRDLMARPSLTADHASQRAVGYRQGWQWLGGEIDYASFRQRAITATRQLAKRQLTWLRGMDGLEVIAAESARPEDLLRRLPPEVRAH
ncbi:MAG: tRNA (adenosine(37)-N6)-dimethylallyltransferase MiaA [Thioalkalivibrio sp.]|nr:MAG: tRNA (adenosine(37)-N6)-dimethylallyltransferase MiaA [Thioalkalivibrio sp.]